MYIGLQMLRFKYHDEKKYTMLKGGVQKKG